MDAKQSKLNTSFFLIFMKQLRICKDQWSCWKEDLKGLGDKVGIS